MMVLADEDIWIAEKAPIHEFGSHHQSQKVTTRRSQAQLQNGSVYLAMDRGGAVTHDCSGQRHAEFFDRSAYSKGSKLSEAQETGKRGWTWRRIQRIPKAEFAPIPIELS